MKVLVLRLLFLSMCLAQASYSLASSSVCLTTCIDVTKPAKKVVALNWTVAEMLLTLDVVPLGVTEGNGYRKWQTNTPELPRSVTEVGRRQEPNLAVIAALKPDLIVGYEFRHRHILEALEKIAPTLLYQQFGDVSQPNFSYFDTSQRVFFAISKAVDEEAKAQSIVASMREKLSQLSHQLSQANLENLPVSFGKFVGMGYGLRMFSDRSLAGEIAQQLGLDYTWNSALPGKDFTHLQLEQLPALTNTHLILAGNQVDSERMTTSPVWPHLPFMQQNNHSSVEPLFSFGGPLSSLKMAQAFTQSLLTWQAQSND
ncbi:ABC transporter substrate-binding protein [Vibrio sp. WJH972]